ncbi:MAG: hypothetical protein ACK5Q8_05820, partial [Phycisphaerales bacterium]
MKIRKSHRHASLFAHRSPPVARFADRLYIGSGFNGFGLSGEPRNGGPLRIIVTGDVNGSFNTNYFFTQTGQPEFATVGGNWNATTTLGAEPTGDPNFRGLWQGASTITGSFGGVTRVARMNRTLNASRITGQVVLNAFGNASNGWDPAATVTVGSNVLTPPDYLATPQQIGGGSIGLAPFRMHRTASTPAYSGTGSGTINNTSKTMPAYESPAVAFYGPVKPG